MSGVVWVAGGAGGIGQACVSALGVAGHRVVATDLPDVDITQPGGCEMGIARATADNSRLTGAVHAVGMSGRRLGDARVTDCTDEGWDEVLRVNLTSVFRFLRATLRVIEDGGSIVIIGSALASTLDRDFLTAAYRVAKAGIIPLAEAAAYEAAERQIRVNVVAAGLVQTPMAARALADDAIQARMPQLMPLSGRAVTAEEVADAVTWLMSPGSSMTTGTVVPVDGGWSLR
jgi:NAD(P)-dependent dehydrogenase (short-subunit alcohol dehydrogenase family)